MKKLVILLVLSMLPIVAFPLRRITYSASNIAECYQGGDGSGVIFSAGIYKGKHWAFRFQYRGRAGEVYQIMELPLDSTPEEYFNFLKAEYEKQQAHQEVVNCLIEPVD